MSLDAKQLYQLRSAARRGLLENDLILERFFQRYASELNEDLGAALSELLKLDDNDLLDLLLARKELNPDLDTETSRAVLSMLRQRQ
ncbi:MAG: succinate dehydrogenase assembly factor 2 [Burkholderiales bacterium]|jgi:antitoxin CptB|uniref:FAD assembly factor SdhE n=1 Tax=Polynucleobacter sp. UK-FUSCHL-C3 TaxID=2955208 RepID=A0AAU8A4N2_9BURK|nr:succinate dehydrogenase assembly factor 2 [Burkholderiales bacterium]